MLPGKGMPGEDSTTNSGYASVSDNAQTVAGHNPAAGVQPVSRARAATASCRRRLLLYRRHRMYRATVRCRGRRRRWWKPFPCRGRVCRNRRRSNPLHVCDSSCSRAGGRRVISRIRNCPNRSPAVVVETPPVEKADDQAVAGRRMLPSRHLLPRRWNRPSRRPQPRQTCPRSPAPPPGPLKSTLAARQPALLVIVDADARRPLVRRLVLFRCRRGRHAMTGALDGYMSINRNFEVTGESSGSGGSGGVCWLPDCELQPARGDGFHQWPGAAG